MSKFFSKVNGLRVINICGFKFKLKGKTFDFSGGYEKYNEFEKSLINLTEYVDSLTTQFSAYKEELFILKKEVYDDKVEFTELKEFMNSLYHIKGMNIDKLKIYNKIKSKIKENKKISAVFYVLFDSIFQYDTVYSIMLNDSLFDVKIVVIPNQSIDHKSMMEQLNKTYITLNGKYGDNVIKSYDENTGDFIDFKDEFDLTFYCNPYDTLTHKYYSIKYSAEYSLGVYFGYGFDVSNWYIQTFGKSSAYLNSLWVFFLPNPKILDLWQQHSELKQFIVTGYIKIDSMYKIPVRKRARKRIIIAPHHTVNNKILKMSNFLKYSELFLNIPKIYPEIDFVFRPHPMLIEKLKSEVWGEIETVEYLNKIKSCPNVEYQDGGDYFDTFVNSDGIIHDCGSFIAEYLFTDKPACYMLKDDVTNESNFNSFAKECIEHYYKAYSEDDILSFINDVVINGNDFMKDERISFAVDNVRYNYPNSSKLLVKHIKDNFFL